MVTAARPIPVQYVLTAAVLLFVVAAGISLPGFLSFENITQVLRQVSVGAIIAIGVTFVVIAGRLDLSVGSLLSMCAVVAVVTHNSAGPIAAIAAALAIGLAVGLLNGFLVAVLRLNSLIVTLGMLSLLQGLTLILSNGKNALVTGAEGTWFAVIGRGYLWGVPVPVVTALVLGAAASVLLTRTTFGRRIFAVGGNETASVYSSINANRTILLAYMLSGLMTAIAAVVFSSRVMAARNDSGAGYEIVVLSGIILGGTSLIGGSGGVVRSLIGVLVLGFIQNILLLLGLPYYSQWLVTWAVIILAVWFDLASRRGSILAW